MPHKVFFLVLSFLICSLLGSFLMIRIRRLLRRRVARLEKRLGIGEDAPAAPQLRISPEYQAGSGLVAKVDRGFGLFISQTGIELSPETAFLIAVAVGLTLCGVVLLWRDDFVMAAVSMLAGMGAVFSYYAFCRSRRRGEIREQLPDVMDLLARAVRAGESLDQAVHLVGETVPKPLGPEFRRCAQQLEMGLSIEAAMQSITRRAPVTEIRILASALMVQRKSGGSLPITLERLGAVIRDRLNYHRQFRATTAAGRVSTMLIASAGPLVAVYMLVWQRAYFAKFVESVPGQLMLGTAIFLQVVGCVWIYQLLRTDY
jgi:tight adherence protein B